MRTPQFEVTRQPSDYLVNRLAGRLLQFDAIACVAVEEALAEKIISFLRRYAQHQAGAMAQQWDETLVRHILRCVPLRSMAMASMVSHHVESHTKNENKKSPGTPVRVSRLNQSYRTIIRKYTACLNQRIRSPE